MQICYFWLDQMIMKKNLNRSSGEPLYLQIASGLEKMISDEILKIGDKLPSVRMFSDEYGVSMGTAFQAYYHLEAKGLIEARPKSGYYVRFNMRRMPGLPQVVDPRARRQRSQRAGNDRHRLSQYQFRRSREFFHFRAAAQPAACRRS